MLGGMFYWYKNGSANKSIAFGLLWYVKCPFYCLWEQTNTILLLFLYTCICEIHSKGKCPNQWIVVGPFDAGLFVECRFCNFKHKIIQWNNRNDSRYHFAGISREYLNVTWFFPIIIKIINMLLVTKHKTFTCTYFININLLTIWMTKIYSFVCSFIHSDNHSLTGFISLKKIL